MVMQQLLTELEEVTYPAAAESILPERRGRWGPAHPGPLGGPPGRPGTPGQSSQSWSRTRLSASGAPSGPAHVLGMAQRIHISPDKNEHLTRLNSHQRPFRSYIEAKLVRQGLTGVCSKLLNFRDSPICMLLD